MVKEQWPDWHIVGVQHRRPFPSPRPRLAALSSPSDLPWLPRLSGPDWTFFKGLSSSAQVRYSAPLNYGLRVSPHLLGIAHQQLQVSSCRGQGCVFWDLVDQEQAGPLGHQDMLPSTPHTCYCPECCWQCWELGIVTSDEDSEAGGVGRQKQMLTVSDEQSQDVDGVCGFKPLPCPACCRCPQVRSVLQGLPQAPLGTLPQPGRNQGDRLAFWAPMLAVLSVPHLALLEGGRGGS